MTPMNKKANRGDDSPRWGNEKQSHYYTFVCIKGFFPWFHFPNVFFVYPAMCEAFLFFSPVFLITCSCFALVWESVNRKPLSLLAVCSPAEPCIIAFARRGRTFLLVLTSVLSACPRTPWVMTEDGASRLDWASCALTFGEMSFFFFLGGEIKQLPDSSIFSFFLFWLCCIAVVLTQHFCSLLIEWRGRYRRHSNPSVLSKE